MFSSFPTRKHRGAQGAQLTQVQTLHTAMNQLSRAPVFYTRFGVPDTTDGRFDLYSLILALLLFRLQHDQAELAQALFDYSFKQQEIALREAGAGDLSVPKQMKKMLQVFYGRASLYHEALEQGEPAALVPIFARNIYNSSDSNHAPMLAQWVSIIWDYLRDIDTEGLLIQPNALPHLLPHDSQKTEKTHAA